ncbi:MAG: TonB-dependent receptor, partial [Deltaproteobacteria bacterium]|nr:TonB-dependent receptor [Deltaproteobacteria bacterium]
EKDSGSLIGAEVKTSMSESSYRMDMGFELKDNFMQNMIFYSNKNGYTFDFKHDSVSYGVYLGFIYNLLTDLRLNLSSRYDYFEFYEDALSGRAALIYNPDRKSVLKLIAGNAYRPPNIYEMYYNDNNRTQKAPENLKPEIIYQTELVYERSLSENLSLNISVYYTDMENMIGFETDPRDGLIIAKNSSSVKIAGIEGRFAYNSPSGEIAGINYNYSYPLNDFWNSFPSHLVKIRTAYPLLKSKLIPALSFNFISGTKTLGNNTLDSVFLCNLNFLYKGLSPNIDISAGIYNLFNQKYLVPASVEHDMDAIRQEGINFRINISGRF